MENRVRQINSYIKPTKCLGIIGGMGSMAGIMLARKVIQHTPVVQDQDQIETFIHSNSKIPDRTKAILSKETSPVKELIRSIELLNAQGIDIIAMACVTSYYFLDDIKNFANGKIINPINLVAGYVDEKYRNVKRIGLMASTGTVKSMLFQKEFSALGIEVVLLSDEEQENLMETIYMKNGLKGGSVSSNAIERLHLSAQKLLDRNIDVLVGGCSEIYSELFETPLDVPFVDTLDVMASEIVKLCYAPVVPTEMYS